jgi:DNA-binding transcriptional LysR family regulator
MAFSNLTVAAMPAAGLYFLPKLLAEFQAKHPTASSTLNIRSSPKVLELAIAQQFDVGFSLLPADHFDVMSLPLLRLEALVIAPQDHPLAEADCVRPEDFRGERFVSLGIEDRSAHIIDEMFNEAGVAPTVIARVDLAAAACEYVRRAGGLAIIEPMTALGSAAEGLVRLKLRPAVHFVVHMLLPLRRPASLIRDNFVEYLHEDLDRGRPYMTYVANLAHADAMALASPPR